MQVGRSPGPRVTQTHGVETPGRQPASQVLTGASRSQARCPSRKGPWGQTAFWGHAPATHPMTSDSTIVINIYQDISQEHLSFFHLLKSWKLWPHRSMPAWGQLAEAPLYHHACWPPACLSWGSVLRLAGDTRPCLQLCSGCLHRSQLDLLRPPSLPRGSCLLEHHQMRLRGDPTTRPCLPHAPSAPRCVSLAPPGLGGPALNLGTLPATPPPGYPGWEWGS